MSLMIAIKIVSLNWIFVQIGNWCINKNYCYLLIVDNWNGNAKIYKNKQNDNILVAMDHRVLEIIGFSNHW